MEGRETMYEAGDLERLAYEVRRFLDKGDYMVRLCGMAKLYLEFPDIGTMASAHMSIMRAIPKHMMVPSREPYRKIDNGTIEIEVGGISVILTCKKRFITPSGVEAGYNQTMIVQRGIVGDEHA